MVKIINLYGSPGCGKSTTATSLFSKMKMMDISVEITLEYVKKYAWKKIPIGKYDQYYIFGKQLQSVTTLLDKVDYIITDSPILLAGYYMKKRTGSYYLQDICCKVEQDLVEDGVEIVNYFLPRMKKYNPKGRYETEEEANQVNEEILGLLKSKSINHKIVDCADKDRTGFILQDLKLLAEVSS